MGFWQGLNAGFTAVEEQRTRKREREEDLKLRKEELAEQRAFERENFMMRIKQDRLGILQERYLQKKAEEAEANTVSTEASSFFNRLEGVDPEVVKLYQSNPMYAAQAERAVREAERNRAEAGQTGARLAGNLLVEMVPPPSARVQTPNIDVSDFENLNINDDNVYFGLYEQTNIPAQQEFSANPELFRVVNPDVLKEGRLQFDTKVLQLALEEKERLNTDETRVEFSEFSDKLKNYKEASSPDRVEILQTFGPAALADLMSMDNPYLQDLTNTPEFTSIVPAATEILKLRNGIQDPNVSEEDKDRARAILFTRYGVSQ